MPPPPPPTSKTQFNTMHINWPPQIFQKASPFALCIEKMCDCTASPLAKVFPQYLQLKGFSPVWILTCVVSLYLWLNEAPQC